MFILKGRTNFRKLFFQHAFHKMAFQVALVVKNPPGNAEDTLIPGLGRSTRIENGTPLQYSCLENLMDTGAWWAMVHRVRVRHNWRGLACTHDLNSITEEITQRSQDLGKGGRHPHLNHQIKKMSSFYPYSVCYKIKTDCSKRLRQAGFDREISTRGKHIALVSEGWAGVRQQAVLGGNEWSGVDMRWWGPGPLSWKRDVLRIGDISRTAGLYY